MNELPRARPIVIAHRAANDLDRARLAMTAGADLLEADVWLYRRRLELRHLKTARGLPILWDKWSLTHSFGRRLSLASMLSALPPDQGVMLDLKGNDRALPAAVLDVLALHPRTGPLAVCSQNWRLLEPFGVEAPDILPIHSIGGLRRLRRVLAHEAPPMHAISIHERFLAPKTIAALKAIAPIVLTWHVNDPQRLGVLLQSGIDGVITDSLDLVRATMSARGRGDALIAAVSAEQHSGG